MSRPLTDSVARIISQLLIDLQLGTPSSNRKPWPVNVSFEPNSPDEVITVYDAAGFPDGRLMDTGELVEHPGFQVRVRSKYYETGALKIAAIAAELDEVQNSSVTIGMNSHTIASISRPSTILPIGRDPDSGREIFVANGRVTFI